MLIFGQCHGACEDRNFLVLPLSNCPLFFLQVGDRIAGGDIYGLVQENSLLEHRVMLPPNARGNITYLAAPGEYNIEDKVIEVEFQGVKKVCSI